MKVNILLSGSPLVITVELPEGINFVGWCKNLKSDGGVFADQLHIPYEKIIAVGSGEITAAPFQTAPTAPSTETKQ